ncbi:ABC transporter substrate-binding protein [soil metagenome]
MANHSKADALLEEIIDGRLNRRTLLKRAAVLGLTTPVMAGLLAACGDEDEPDEPDVPATGATEPPASGDATAGTEATEPAAEETSGSEAGETPADAGEAEEPAGEGVYGGRLRVAIIGEPPTLDIHQTTATIVALITWHMYEALFTWDEEFATIPLLAESFEVSDDGMTNSITLRQGVLFHDGTEMTAADVIASFERWAGISGLGKSIMDVTDEIVEVDDYNIEFNMASPLGSFVVLLARQNQGLAIYPASVVEASGTDSLADFVGTGPYQFTEQQADRFILFSRFEDYVGQEGEANGYAGPKAAYLDEIEFVPVPDEAARIAGLQAGDYHYLESIIPDQVQTLENDPNVAVETLPPSGWEVLVLNTAQGVMTDLKIRQAFQAAIACEPVLQASQGEGFFRLDPSFMLQETVWHSTVSEELYNQGDPEKCRQLLEEAGYDGTPLRFLTTQEYQDQYNTAVVARQQLEDAGFTVELLVTDWATLIANRAIEDQWEVFTTGFSFRPDPVGMPPVPGCNWPGWWCTDEKVEVVGRLQGESDFDARFEAFEELQALWYSDIPGVKLGDSFGITARSPMLQGLGSTLSQLQPEFVNAWLEEE